VITEKEKDMKKVVMSVVLLAGLAAMAANTPTPAPSGDEVACAIVVAN
jgi:hypothetical protein